MKKLLLCILGILLSLSIFGCSSVTPSSVVNNYLAEKKKEARQEGANALISSAEEKDMFSSNPEAEIKFYEMLTEYEYIVNNEQINGESATVDVTFKTYDFKTFIGNVLSDYFQKAFALAFSGASEEEMNSTMAEILGTRIEETKSEGKILENKISLNLYKTNEGWEIVESDLELISNGILGGLVEAFNSFESE